VILNPSTIERWYTERIAPLHCFEDACIWRADMERALGRLPRRELITLLCLTLGGPRRERVVWKKRFQRRYSPGRPRKLARCPNCQKMLSATARWYACPHGGRK